MMTKENFAEAPCYILSCLKKPQSSPFQDENLLYLQPATRRPIVYSKGYSKPRIRMESKTTYDLSYMEPGCTSKPVAKYEKQKKIIPSNTGKFDFDTIHNLSYQIPNGKKARIFYPKSCLSISGSHNMTTIHATSYTYPGYIKVTPYKPVQGKIHHSVPMACKTTMKESYQNCGTPSRVKKQFVRQFWQTKCKTDYETVNRLSFKPTKLAVKKFICNNKYRPFTATHVEKDTIYNTSFQVPGSFVNKDC